MHTRVGTGMVWIKPKGLWGEVQQLWFSWIRNKVLNHSPRWRQCPEYPLNTDWDRWLCHLDFFSNHFFCSSTSEIRVVRGVFLPLVFVWFLFWLTFCVLQMFTAIQSGFMSWEFMVKCSNMRNLSWIKLGVRRWLQQCSLAFLLPAVLWIPVMWS